MPERGGRTPVVGSLLGFGIAAGAEIIAWLAYEQAERASFVAESTFGFRRIDWLWVQVLFLAAGVLFGLVIVLALRGPAGSRRATLLGAAIPPALVFIGFWWFLYIGFPWSFGQFTPFLIDTATLTAAGVSAGVLLTLAAVPAGSHRPR